MAVPAVITIGEISYRPNAMIGYGSHLTAVYRGTFGKRSVAVKKIPIHFAEVAKKEQEMLLRIDVHPNIVRYYHMETDHEGYYLALLLCDYTLIEYMTKGLENLNLTPIILLREITFGLKFLHDSQIIHHDLKPLNILISYPNHTNERKAMISDFGVSKETLGTRASATLTFRRGTDGFVSPEVFYKDTVTNAIDVFSLGCIYFYVLSLGDYLFYSHNDVEDQNMYHAHIKKLMKPAFHDYQSLILRMICREPSQRQTCDQILFHHIFWGDEKKMQFLQVASDLVEKNEHERSAIDASATEIIGRSWHDKMPENVIADLVNGKRNQGKKTVQKEFSEDHIRYFMKKFYDGTRLSTLLRAIRNISNHYSDIIVLSKGDFTSSEAFMEYCFKQFPKLFSQIYDIAEKWDSHKNIAKFYKQRTGNVNQISYQLEPQIKHTRNGTTLYKGKYNDITVAVKMYHPNYVSLGENELHVLENIKHRNIIRIVHKERQDDVLYIATTLGQYNLFEYVENYWNNDNPVPVQLLRQITCGLDFLHGMKIAHCDLTPKNILISYPNKFKDRRAMISDFESSHKFDMNSKSKSGKAVSQEWLAPELRKTSVTYGTEAGDIFSLGCIYLYVLTNGEHSFGKDLVIDDEEQYLQNIAESVPTAGCYSGLIKRMLDFSPQLRPTSSKILYYPTFWDMKRKVRFLEAVILLATTNYSAEKQLRHTPGELSTMQWISKVHPNLRADLEKAWQTVVHEDTIEYDKPNDENADAIANKWLVDNKVSSVINVMLVWRFI